MVKIVVASSNLGKLREYRQLLKALDNLEFLSCRNYGILEMPEETGSSFSENSEIKAQAVFDVVNSWTIADDSGLVVPALKGAPGVFSARYAGIEATDRTNMEKLLQEMEVLEGSARSAYFECCITLLGPDGYRRTFDGRCEGRIIDEMRGGNGFGYDPLFIKNDYDKTFAELGEHTKNIISHRGKAVEKLKLALEYIR